MAKTKKTVPKQPEPEKHYYRLAADSEAGQEFMSIVERGMEFERMAEELAESVEATEFISRFDADFGGISSFIFHPSHTPDPEVFSCISGDDKVRLYLPAVNEVRRVALQEDMPTDESPRIVRRRDNLTVRQVLAVHPEQDVAQAVGVKLKCAHPLKFLHLMGYSKEEVQPYAKGQMSIGEVLALRPTNTPRLQKQAEYAIMGDKERQTFALACEGRLFGDYIWLDGTDKAMQLWQECQALPLMPYGALNATIGIPTDMPRCGFFLHGDYIWIQSKGEARCADICEVSQLTWSMACKDAKQKDKKTKSEDKK